MGNLREIWSRRGGMEVGPLVGSALQPACCCAFLTILMGGTIRRSGCGSGIVKRGRVTPGGFMACGKREPQSGLLGVPCPMPCHICDLVRLI
jgi:hypothetical protein